jgi:hypothetical protein
MRSMHDPMVWMNGAELKARLAKPEPTLDPSVRSLGERRYDQHCAVGAKGNGSGPRATELSPPPRDFTSGMYKLRSTPTGALPADEVTAMVPWDSLFENELWASSRRTLRAFRHGLPAKPAQIRSLCRSRRQNGVS